MSACLQEVHRSGARPRRVPVARTRLTTRGRAVLMVVLVLLLLAAFSLGRTRSEAASASPDARPSTQATVHRGDTLWSIAAHHYPGSDPRQVVEQIRTLNHLEAAEVRTGQQLLLPLAA